MPATLEAPRMVSAPDKTVTFLARRSGLKLVRKPERDKHDSEGNVYEKVPGEKVAFTEGILRVNPAGRHRGENHEDLDGAEIIAWLKAHRLFGDREEGFWLLEQPAPTPTEQENDNLTELAMELDVSGLEAFIAQEQAGWDRPALLGTARKALERATAKLAELAPAKPIPGDAGKPEAPKAKQPG